MFHKLFNCVVEPVVLNTINPMNSDTKNKLYELL